MKLNLFYVHILSTYVAEITKTANILTRLIIKVYGAFTSRDYWRNGVV